MKATRSPSRTGDFSVPLQPERRSTAPGQLQAGEQVKVRRSSAGTLQAAADPT